MLAFGITSEVDEQFLAAVSGDVMVPNGVQRLGVDYFTAPSFQALDNIQTALAISACKSPVIGNWVKCFCGALSVGLYVAVTETLGQCHGEVQFLSFWQAFPQREKEACKE